MKCAQAGCKLRPAYRPYRERCAEDAQYGGAAWARVSGGACGRGAFAANDMGPAAGQRPVQRLRMASSGWRILCAMSLRALGTLDGGATRARVSGGACGQGAFAANDMGPAAGQMHVQRPRMASSDGDPTACSAACLRALESSRPDVQDGGTTSLRMGGGSAPAGNMRAGAPSVLAAP